MKKKGGGGCSPMKERCSSESEEVRIKQRRRASERQVTSDRGFGSGIIQFIFLVKNLPPSLPVTLQDYGQRDVVYQAVFSLRQPSYVVHTHTVPRDQGPPPPPLTQ